jgi:chromosome segregation ATPase
LLGGCAGSDEREAAFDDEFARASASITEAESAGAYEHGSAELEMARSKLNAAEEAAEEGEQALAARLAKEAELDATLASAIAQNQEMQDAVTEIERSIETLEQEISRNQSQSAGSQLPPAGRPL